jgi:hypothetical protein
MLGSPSVTISRVLHAGYIFSSEKTKIAFDPVFENPFSHNCYAYPNVEFDTDSIKRLRFDAIFISHFHDDHCSFESLNLLARDTPVYVYCIFEELRELILELGFKNVYILELGQSVRIGTIEILPLKALDCDVDSIFHIRVGTINILNVVDSWIDPETMKYLATIPKWDLILWPFQTLYELEVLSPMHSQLARPHVPGFPHEWIEQLKILQPRCIVPSSCQFIHESWSWYNQAMFPISYARFETEIANVLPDTHVLKLNPSVTVELNKTSILAKPPLDWIKPIGDQEADYKFCPSPQTTPEISQHFPALTKTQSDEVVNFCTVHLIEKYQNIERDESNYFMKPRNWKLSIYDHEGGPLHFYFLIDRSGTKLVPDFGDQIDWMTEVPAYKIFAALNLGETLASMYVRVIAEADVMEDPLIVALFTNEFASYQKAQLARLSLPSHLI